MSEIYLGNLLADLDIWEPSAPVSGVYLKVDGEKGYMAGDESGLVIECECPWGSAEMAYNILAKMKGFVYEPFSGTDALLDPAAELGDAITVGGHYGILATLGRNLDRQSAATVGAPGTDEIDDEYPYQSKQTRQTDRVLAKAYSRISKTSEEIRLEVVKKIDEDTANTLISAAIGKIELSVSSKNGSTTFTLTDGKAELSAKTLNLTVDAVNVTGKLTASQIDAEELHVNAANIDGTLKASQLQLSGAIAFGDLDDDLQDAINSAGGLDEDEVTTLITESLVQSPTIMGGEFYDIDEVGRLTLSYNGRAWMIFAGVDSGREMFGVGGTDYGNSTDVTLMTFADETILQKTGYGETYLTNNVNIELPLSTALESADIVDKLKSVLGLS